MRIVRALISGSLKARYAFALCILLTLGATYFAFRSSRLENASRFERTVQTMANTIQSRLTIYSNAILYTRNLFHVHPQLTESQFKKFIQEMKLPENFPGIQSIGYVERLNRHDAELRLKKMGLPPEASQSDPSSNELDIIIYFERLFPSTSRLQGVDLGSSSQRKQAMNEARDLGLPVATDRVDPIGVRDGSVPAFLVFLPRYKEGVPLDTVEDRRKALIGFVYGGFRAANLFSRISDDVRASQANLAIRIYDRISTDAKDLMFSEGNFDQADKNLSRIIELRAAQHTWTMEVAAPKGFGLAYLRWSPYVVLILGLMLSFAVGISLRRSECLTASLKSAREEADKANQAKTIFLANISHEIRTPLSAIIGFAESALHEDGPDQKNSYVRTILRNGKELSRIIGDVLDLSKVEAKTLMIEIKNCSLKKLHAELLEIWQQKADQKNLQFKFIQSEFLPEYIQSDETRLKQILVNLLSNAFKFTSQGEICVQVSKKVTANGEIQLVYTVDDTGIGIPEENREKLFKAFSQGDSSITRRYGGSGLGLAISRELAQALGGDVQLAKNPSGKGSRFVVSLPLLLGEASPALETPQNQEDEILAGKKILIVEDVADNQMLMAHILKKFSVEITFANDGQEGVKLASQENFDLILMDIQMPIMDGYVAFAEMKKLGIQTPVIALTANAMKKERDFAVELGFAAYLTKPIDRAQLIRVSAEYLGKQHGHA